MTSHNTTTTKKPAKPDLVANYRPVALKAVVAATLMVRRKPKKQMA